MTGEGNRSTSAVSLWPSLKARTHGIRSDSSSHGFGTAGLSGRGEAGRERDQGVFTALPERLVSVAHLRPSPGSRPSL